MSLTIDRDRLLSEIDALASISEAEAPAVTRIVFTPTDLKARAWMKARCEEAGLTVRHDAVGNTFARWNGSDPTAPVVGTGSHIDAIPNAGKYDGVVGVLGGLEAIRGVAAEWISSQGIRLSCLFSLPKNRHVLESDASGAGCCLARFLQMRRES